MSDVDEHSIHNEPHRRKESFESDPSEEHAEDPEDEQSERLEAQQSVWSEPSLSRTLTGVPDTPAPYQTWLEENRKQTTSFQSWRNTIIIALLSAPWAVLGAFYGGGKTWFAVLSAVVFAPFVEELMKVGIALYTIETRPFWFQSPLQIIVCALGGGLGFAVIENLIYFHVYLADPSLFLVYWRWTVCVALHMGCSLIASMGLIRIWRDLWKHKYPARIHLGFPYLTAAVLVHAAYNLTAFLMEYAGVQF